MAIIGKTKKTATCVRLGKGGDEKGDPNKKDQPTEKATNRVAWYVTKNYRFERVST